MILYLLTLFSLFNKLYKFFNHEDFVWRQWMPTLFSLFICYYFKLDFIYSTFIFRLIGLAIDALLIIIESAGYLVTKGKLKDGWKVYVDVIAMHTFYRMILKSNWNRVLYYMVDCCIPYYPIVFVLNWCIIPLAYPWVTRKFAFWLWPKCSDYVFKYIPLFFGKLTDFYAVAYNKVLVPSAQVVASGVTEVVKEIFITISEACENVKGAQKSIDKDSPDYETYDVLYKVVSVGGIFKDIPLNFKSYINNLVSYTQCCMTIKNESGLGFVKNGSIILNHVDEPIVCNFALSSIIEVNNKTITHLLDSVNGECFMLKNKPTATRGYIRPKAECKGRNQRPLHNKTLNQVKVSYARRSDSIVLPPVYVDLKGKVLNMDKTQYLEYLKDYNPSGLKYSDGFNPSLVKDVRVSVQRAKTYGALAFSNKIMSLPVITATSAFSAPKYTKHEAPVTQNTPADVPVWVDEPKETKPVIDNVVEEPKQAERSEATVETPKQQQRVSKPYGYMAKYSELLEDNFEYVETLKSKKEKFLLIFKRDIRELDDDDLLELRKLIYSYGKAVIELNTIEYVDCNNKLITLESDEEDMYIMICLPGRMGYKLEKEHKHENNVYNNVKKSTIKEIDYNASTEYDSEGEEITQYKVKDINTPEITTTEEEKARNTSFEW